MTFTVIGLLFCVVPSFMRGWICLFKTIAIMVVQEGGAHEFLVKIEIAHIVKYIKPGV